MPDVWPRAGHVTIGSSHRLKLEVVIAARLVYPPPRAAGKIRVHHTLGTAFTARPSGREAMLRLIITVIFGFAWWLVFTRVGASLTWLMILGSVLGVCACCCRPGESEGGWIGHTPGEHSAEINEVQFPE